MPQIFNEKTVAFKLRKTPVPEFAWYTSPGLADLVKAKQLRFDIRSLEPGKFSYPYHSHRNAEELFVILSGSATLRTPAGFQVVTQGDIIFMEMGPTGAHQLYNHTAQPCRYLDICTEMGLDVCDYPDSGKINLLPYREIFQADSQVDYYEGEAKVKEKWPAEIVGGE